MTHTKPIAPSLGNNLHETKQICIFFDADIEASRRVVKTLWELIKDAGLCKEDEKQSNYPVAVTGVPIRTSGPIKLTENETEVTLLRGTVMVVFMDHMGYANGILCCTSNNPGSKLAATLFFNQFAMALGAIAVTKNPERFESFRKSAASEQANEPQVRAFVSDFLQTRRKILEAFEATQANIQKAIDRAQVKEAQRRTGSPNVIEDWMGDEQ